MSSANNNYAASQVKVASASAAAAADGVNRSYNLKLNTADRVFDLESEANQTRFDAQIKAADITRTAGLDRRQSPRRFELMRRRQKPERPPSQGASRSNHR